MRLMGENQPYQLASQPASQLVSQACHTKQPTNQASTDHWHSFCNATLLMSCSAALRKWRKDFLAFFLLFLLFCSAALKHPLLSACKSVWNRKWSCASNLYSLRPPLPLAPLAATAATDCVLRKEPCITAKSSGLSHQLATQPHARSLAHSLASSLSLKAKRKCVWFSVVSWVFFLSFFHFFFVVVFFLCCLLFVR